MANLVSSGSSGSHPFNVIFFYTHDISNWKENPKVSQGKHKYYHSSQAIRYLHPPGNRLQKRPHKERSIDHIAASTYRKSKFAYNDRQKRLSRHRTTMRHASGINRRRIRMLGGRNMLRSAVITHDLVKWNCNGRQICERRSIKNEPCLAFEYGQTPVW